MKRNGGRLESLVPYSTKPKHFRTVKYDAGIVKFIRKQRDNHPRIGKEKLKPLLDEDCKLTRIKTVSESTIGNIIKSHNMFHQKSGRYYHNPNGKWAGESWGV